MTIHADNAVNLPWRTIVHSGHIETLGVRVQGGRPWRLQHTHTADKSLNEAPATMWIAKYLAEQSNKTPADAKKSHDLWLALLKYTTDRMAGTDILPYAVWWALEDVRPATENASQLYQWRTTLTPDVFKDGRPAEREALLLALADENSLPRAPATASATNDMTLNFLDRDAGALWSSWTWCAIPCYEPPVLTLWCVDPVTARFLQHDAAEGKVAALIQPTPPLAGRVNCGLLSASQWLDAVAWKTTDLKRLLSYN